MASQNNIYTVMITKCSCGNEIGSRQREFEMLFDSFRESGDEVDVASKKTLKEMKVIKMCCRRHFLRPPNFLLANRTSEKFVDTSNVTGSIIVRPAEDLKPGVELEFPLL